MMSCALTGHSDWHLVLLCSHGQPTRMQPVVHIITGACMRKPRYQTLKENSYKGHKSSYWLQCGIIWNQSSCYHGHYGCKDPGQESTDTEEVRLEQGKGKAFH